ncbi:unnamed protein product, partial [Prorocentrum cordatum]
AESAKFVEEHFREFFRDYNGLLESEDYVTQRQALKLLSEMLLDRTFMRVMLSYIGDETYLQIHMNLLRADSKAIQFEAFHVFKIFVANPYKPPKVCHILYKNKDGWSSSSRRCGRAGRFRFAQDKSTVIGKLQSLEPPPKVAPGGGGGSAPGRSQRRRRARRGRAQERRRGLRGWRQRGLPGEVTAGEREVETPGAPTV